MSVTIKRLTGYKQKVVLDAMLEGKSVTSNMAANTNDTTLLKNQSAIKYLPEMRFLSNSGVRWFLCALSIIGISKIPAYCLKKALVTWPPSASGLLDPAFYSWDPKFLLWIQS